MLSDSLKVQIDLLWSRFWAGGIANPLAAIEQISYLIFIKRLEEVDNREQASAKRNGRRFKSRFKGHGACRWSALRHLPPEKMLRTLRDRVFPFLKKLPTNGNTFSEAMRDAVFAIPKASLLREAVKIIDELPFETDNWDTTGDLYEHLLSELSLAGKNGQFRTSRHIISAIVRLVAPVPGERICDPAAGTAGFLVEAYTHVRRQLKGTSTRLLESIDGDRLVGFDFDTTMVRLGLMNMMLHGVRHPEIRYKDTLSRSFTPSAEFNVILANPPFTGSIDDSEVNRDALTLETTKTELLFVELCLALLVPQGRGAIIVPEGVLFGTSKAHVELRRRLVDENVLQAVISLPSGCFRPYTGVKTAILLFTRSGRTSDVFFFRVTGDGFTLDDRRQPDPAHDDLQYVDQAYRILGLGLREEWRSKEAEAVAVDRSLVISGDRIRASGFSLRAASYMEHTVSDEHSIDPRELLDELEAIEKQIAFRLRKVSTGIAKTRRQGRMKR